MRSQNIFCLGILFSATLVGLGLSQAVKPTNKSVATVCTPSGDEKCPDAKDYSSLMQYIAKYKQPLAPQDEQDRITGLIMRLSQQAPKGYHLDTTTGSWKYVKNPPETATQPTPVPPAK
jgi:hypothetical protein